jgi:imidazolonepropionase-like amidohydrolase
MEVSAGMKAVPVRRLSSTSGEYVGFSNQSSHVTWSLGPHFWALPVSRLNDIVGDPKNALQPYATHIPLGWDESANVPATNVLFVNARIAPMNDMTVIETGYVHVVGETIKAVGAGDPPAELRTIATKIDCKGKTLMPGIVDVHCHTGGPEGGVLPQRHWAFEANLAFGVTTTYDPSNDTKTIHALSEVQKAGQLVAPRIYSTGTILYGADTRFRATVDSLDDARREIARTTAWGALGVKSYNLPRRNQRQWIMQAAREQGVMVNPEGASTLHHNMAHFIDGHTTQEHAIPVAPLFEPELKLMAEAGTCYTPTLVVGYGGLWGERYWYATTNVWENERLMNFVPRSVVDARSRRRETAPDGEWHHFRLARTAAEVYRRGGTVEVGAHGQLAGLGAHWETWMLEQGGLTPHEALRCATYMGARAICMDHRLGSVQPGMLADLIVIDGNPLENVRLSQNVTYVMVGGRLYNARTLKQLAPEERELPLGPDLEMLPQPAGDLCGCSR